MRVAYLGPEGTFSHEALLSAERDAAGVPCASIADALDAVAGGSADRALVPLENSLEGSVNATADALVASDGAVAIVGELVHPIHLALMARAAVALDAVTTVVSHPQPLGQCARFLRRELPAAGIMAAASTAEAARTVAGSAEPWAALAPAAAAERYGCTVLRDGVEDDHANVTRFVWIAPRGTPVADGREFKTSLVFWGAGTDKPGWLVRCLSEFAFRGVNLTRIESRPLRQGLGAYMFFVDLEGRATDEPVAGAIEGLHGQAETVLVLGSFPAA